jgi:tripartite-type tricarboxylate transporter receptor subunit TctC
VWVGVFAPAGTAPALVERLNREITAIAATPELRNLFEPDGMVPVAMTPSAYAARVKQELAQWQQIAASRRITLE